MHERLHLKRLVCAAAAAADSEGRLWGWQQGESCTFKTMLRTPVYITWSNAPTCKDMPATSNSIYDRSGRLW
jgi:hypothetical protein